MIDFRIQNSLNQSVQITNNETVYKVHDITGLGFERTLNLLEYAGKDGSSYNTSKIPSREIVATVAIVGNIETNRQNLLKVLADSGVVNLYFKTENRDVYIQGKAKTADDDLFSESQSAQLAFTCADPFFKKRTSTETSIAKGTTATTVTNSGDVPAWFSATFELTDINNDPTRIVLVKTMMSGPNVGDTQKIAITFPSGFMTGDKITIKNYDSEKDIVLTRGNNNYSLIPYIDWVNTEWFILDVGSNSLRYMIGSAYAYTGTATCKITHNDRYLFL